MGKTTGFITETDCYLFGEGTHYEIYNKLGAHPTSLDGKKGVYFAVWAPHAASVHVIGDFNSWDETSHAMESIGTSGIFERFIPGVKPGRASPRNGFADLSTVPPHLEGFCLGGQA